MHSIELILRKKKIGPPKTSGNKELSRCLMQRGIVHQTHEECRKVAEER
jgi:hypothetical protein